jgi:DNA-binding MarR family transcriptional regulator
MEYSFKEELKKYGLNDKEISIYIFLLSSGSKSISKITTGLGIPRTTIVENISRLVEKGLVAESIENSKKHFIAESPLKLKEILSNKRRSVEQELQSLNKMDTVLPSIVNSLMMHQLKESSEDISIRFYKTKRDVWKGYLESLKSSEVVGLCTGHSMHFFQHQSY